MDYLDSILYILIAVVFYFYTTMRKKAKMQTQQDSETAVQQSLHNMHGQVVPDSWKVSDFELKDLETAEDSQEKILSSEELYNSRKLDLQKRTLPKENFKTDEEKPEELAKPKPKKKKTEFDLRKAIIYNSILERKKF